MREREHAHRQHSSKHCHRAPPSPPSLCWQMPEFTTAKWGCVIDGCRQLRAALQGPNSPLDKFFDALRRIFCGKLQTKQNGEREHPHKHKITQITGLLESGLLRAGVYALIDIWEQRYDTFFKVCKSPSLYGGFPQPHVRHMMAEQVALDTVFYKEARADPVRTAPHPQ